MPNLNTTTAHSDPAPQDFESLPSLKTRIALSAATVAILSMILWCNLPDEVPAELLAAADRSLSPEAAYRIRYGEWLYRYAAHLGGFDNKWQMYGGQSRFNWRYTITAHYSDGDRTASRVLPLPRQSERSWFQATFVDYKEAKFLLNIYNDRLARETYARYLARQFAQHEGLPVSQISYTLSIQYILPPIVAVQQQRLLEPDVLSDVIDVFDVTVEHMGDDHRDAITELTSPTHSSKTQL
ncbi:MAG: hypothetical protein JNM43_09490 [Planctomycetaceae bacterium]|nr:hypothetical protein [Planctomycetaceae bacterium]